MAQDTFLSAFEQIDKDRDGVIYIHDLEQYARNDAVSPDFVQKWRTLFDPQNTGRITFEDFCSTLGVSKKKRDSVLRRIHHEPTIYGCNMPIQNREDTIKIVKKHYQSQNPDSSMHQTLMEMDQVLGPRWQGRAVGKTEAFSPNGEYIVYSLNNGENKYGIWRQPETSGNRGGLCCCC